MLSIGAKTGPKQWIGIRSDSELSHMILFEKQIRLDNDDYVGYKLCTWTDTRQSGGVFFCLSLSFLFLGASEESEHWHRRHIDKRNRQDPNLNAGFRFKRHKHLTSWSSWCLVCDRCSKLERCPGSCSSPVLNADQTLKSHYPGGRTVKGKGQGGFIVTGLEKEPENTHKQTLNCMAVWIWTRSHTQQL